MLSRMVGSVVLGGLMATAANAATVAYWRFEEGPDAGYLAADHGNSAAGTFTVTGDSSGNNNALRTWNMTDSDPRVFTSPLYSSAVAHATVLGQGNNFSFHFTEGGNGNDDIYTGAGTGDLNSHALSQFTIEATVRIDPGTTWFRTIVGKDGKPTGAGDPPLSLRTVGNSNLFNFTYVDSSSTVRGVSSASPLVENAWYDLAVVCDGSTLSLYVKQSADSSYSVTSTAVTGGLVATDATWTVGRGVWNGGLADWFTGNIDEVRISDTALAPTQFLNSVPEPTTVGVFALAGLSLLRRRRS